MKRARADVVVIGGGVIGCATARELARRGLGVTLIERDSPGRRATWAAAGMLSPLGEATGSGAFLDLADESLTRFASFVRNLREETSIDVEYRTNGKLHVSLGEADDELRALAATPSAARFDVSMIDGDAARRLEPLLSDAVTSALLVTRDHLVNNRLLVQALLASATSAGVRVRTASQAAAVIVRHGGVHAVQLQSGEQIEAGHVVIAAGAWSAQIKGLPRPVPVRPIKGQMFAVDARSHAPDRPAHVAVQRVVFGSECYIIPRDDGRLLVGATVEDTGFLKGATPRGIARLMTAASRIMPIIADLPLVEMWAGFRPGTPDHLPILGPDPKVKGLIYATGHFRNGILLAPITAACVADLVSGTAPPVSLDAFGIERFEE